MNFKAGDIVQMKERCSGCLKGKRYTLHFGDKRGNNREFLFAWDDTVDLRHGCNCQDNWIKVSNAKLKIKSYKLTVKIKNK